MRRGDDRGRKSARGKAFLYVDLDGGTPTKSTRGGPTHGAARQTAASSKGAPLRTQTSVQHCGESVKTALGCRLGPPAAVNRGRVGRLAVAPEKLADYLADFRQLLDEYGLTGVMYGHFGAGCMHIRITYDLRSDGQDRIPRVHGGRGELVVRHGGSLSGEHGDGRARSELLGTMYRRRCSQRSPNTANLGPGRHPEPRFHHRTRSVRRQPRTGGDSPSRVANPLHSRPVAAAKADADPGYTPSRPASASEGVAAAGGVMCPSFRATGDEKDSTRGRSRVLQDMVRRRPDLDEGWKSEDVREALDLCLACKACSNDCPAGVDMATYKSEFFSHYYGGHAAHIALLPRLVAALAQIDAIVGRWSTWCWPARSGKSSHGGGLTTGRACQVRFPEDPATRAPYRNPSGPGETCCSWTRSPRVSGPKWPGLRRGSCESTGRTVDCESDACCGLTWISTGQLDAPKSSWAKR